MSHLLSEVEQMATNLAIVAQGSLKFEGTTAEVRSGSKPVVVVETDQPERAEGLLVGVFREVKREGNRISLTPQDGMGAAAINAVSGASRNRGIAPCDATHDARRHVSGVDRCAECGGCGMTMLVRALYAESLKLKRTIALKLVALAPAAIISLVLFLASQSPFSTLGRMGVSNEWTALMRVSLMLWTLLMLPLYMTIASALVARAGSRGEPVEEPVRTTGAEVVGVHGEAGDRVCHGCYRHDDSLEWGCCRWVSAAPATEGLPLRLSRAIGSDVSARGAGGGVSVLCACDPALGESAVSRLFGGNRDWCYRHGSRLCGDDRDTSDGRMAAVLSVGSADAGAFRDDRTIWRWECG